MATETRTTRERLVELLREDPEISAVAAAERLDVSRQRIYQLLKALKKDGETERLVPRRQPSMLVREVAREVSRSIDLAADGLLVSADLVQRGYRVYAPITPRDRVDLITIDRAGHVERVEVTIGVLRDGVITHEERAPEYDRQAIVVRGEPIEYRPELPDIE